MPKTIIFLASVALYILLINASQAQTYIPISPDLNLYCADLHDGTNALVKVVRSKGNYIVQPVDAKPQIKSILRLRRDIRRRVATLHALKKRYHPTTDLQKLKATYKFIVNEIADSVSTTDKFDKTKPNRIYGQLGTMISQLESRLRELDTSLEMIDQCINNEDLLPPAEQMSAEIISLTFKNPDYDENLWLRGFGVSAVLHKKRTSGVVCVSGSGTTGSLPRFPMEMAITVRRNPCDIFWPSNFRNYPFCHYGSNPNMAVGWMSRFHGYAGYAPGDPDSEEIARMEQTLDTHQPIFVRAATKKNPCHVSR